MYFNKDNNFYHGIMFHHFHDDGIHTKGQGSIDRDDFYRMIKFIGRNNILDADIFFERFKKNQLKENNVCLTFDDAIKSFRKHLSWYSKSLENSNEFRFKVNKCLDHNLLNNFINDFFKD